MIRFFFFLNPNSHGLVKKELDDGKTGGSDIRKLLQQFV